MCFETTMLYGIILVYRTVLVQAPRTVSWLLNVVQEDVSKYVFIHKVAAAIVQAVVMVIPHSENLSAIIYHFLIKWIILRLQKLVFNI